MDTSTSVPSSTGGPESRTHHSKAKLCCCWILALLISLALVGSLYGTVWRNLILKQSPDDVFVYNGSAVVIKQLNHYYHRQLRLSPKKGYRLEDSVIEVYRFNSSCDRLPTKNDVIRWEKVNVIGDQNYTHQYLLPGSTLHYTISPVDRDSVRVVDVSKPLDAELGPIGYAYITYGPESKEFDSTKCQSSSDCTIVDDKTFKNGQYYDNSYPVETRGYYNFHSVLVNPQYHYNLDLTVNATLVVIVPTQHICNISDIDEERVCTVDLEFKTGMVCFVAYTEFEGGVIDFEVTERLAKVLLTSMLPPAVFLLVLFGGLASYTFAKLFCHCKPKNQYVSVNAEP